MITNERQYRITKSQAAKFKQALDEYDSEAAVAKGQHPLFAKAHREAMESECQILLEQIGAYEDLKSGRVKINEAVSLKELPTLLIKARIVQGMTQRELAEALGLMEQQIQRYEAGGYSSASLTKLIAVANVLNLSVTNALNLNVNNALNLSVEKEVKV